MTLVPYFSGNISARRTRNNNNNNNNNNMWWTIQSLYYIKSIQTIQMSYTKGNNATLRQS